MTRVALLWHMHQPFYQDLATGEHILPWVRFHAIKDYWGMVALLGEFPTVRATFNLVPSMLVQLEAFARDQARDRHLEIGMTPADRLTEEERAFCIEHFFQAHRPRMIDPYPRYAELLAMRADGGWLSARAQVAQFSVEDLRDLQVWHKLAWVDPFYLDGDERVRALVEKGRGFSEGDKQTLREVELELLRRVVPEYRAAAERGQVELSTSPFYHPILPLLCDTDVYLRTHPESRMPRDRFRHPEDASEQLTRAVGLHERLFGRRPVGLWPSEGSVSDAMVPLVAAAGFRWMATDEEILARTLGRDFSRDASGIVEHPEALYRAYQVGAAGTPVACGFRDHAISDLIGFQYASWAPDDAAANFVGRLEAAGARFVERTGGGEATIFVILDGENAWEHYDGQGRPFLRALYARLAAHPGLRTVTMEEACSDATAALPSIFPGSWINGDFYIWIGHADDHRAWSQLGDARRAVDRPPAGLADEALALAREEVLIAEGSDWFWWYGDDHSSDHDLEFDELFRRHVSNVYRALELPIPEELFVSNITTRPPDVEIQQPSGLIQPTIDGEVSSYFEWTGAGCLDVHAVAGAMHQVSFAEAGIAGAGIAAVEFGFDLEHLFVRVDGTRPMVEILAGDVQLLVKFLKPTGLRLIVRVDGDALGVQLAERVGESGWNGRWTPGLVAAVGTVAEVRIPFSGLGVVTHDPVALFVALARGEAVIEQYPKHRPIELTVPERGFGGANWKA
jgi:alpha-amylase/alpha-mannosidase (GH57 family)